MIGERSRWSCRRYRRRQKRETGTTSALSWHPAQAERAAAVTGHQSATRLPPPQQNGVTANHIAPPTARFRTAQPLLPLIAVTSLAIRVDFNRCSRRIVMPRAVRIAGTIPLCHSSALARRSYARRYSVAKAFQSGYAPPL